MKNGKVKIYSTFFHAGPADALPLGDHRHRAEGKQAERNAAHGQHQNTAEHAHNAVCNVCRLCEAGHAQEYGPAAASRW